MRTGSSRAIYADPLRLAKAGDAKKAPGPLACCLIKWMFSKDVIAFPLLSSACAAHVTIRGLTCLIFVQYNNDVRVCLRGIHTLGMACQASPDTPYQVSVCPKVYMYLCSCTCAPAPARWPQSANGTRNTYLPCSCRWILSRFAEGAGCRASGNQSLVVISCMCP